MTGNDFLRCFAEFQRRARWPQSLGPWSAVERWETLSLQLVDGYQWGFYELDNELGIRDSLERLLQDRELAGFEQTREMATRIRETDERIRAAFLPDVLLANASDPWWHRGVLANAGEEYADDVRRIFGIEINR